MASNTPTDPTDADGSMQPAPAGEDITAAQASAPQAAAPTTPTRRRSTATSASRAEAAKKAAATRARNRAAAKAAEEARAAEAAAGQVEGDDSEVTAADAASVTTDVSTPVEDASPAAVDPAAPASSDEDLPDPMSDPVVLAARRTEEDETQTEEDAPVAVVPSFGLLFQAPTVVPDDAAPAPDVVDAAVEDHEPDTETDVDEDDEDSDDESDRGRRSRGRGRRRGSRRRRDEDDDRTDVGDDRNAPSDEDSGTGESDSEEASESDESDTDDAEEGGRRRRRRGGRGRRRSGKGEDDATDLDENDSEDEDDSNDDSGSDGEASGSGRRRRRRRRGSNVGDSDDPPGTVTRVREPRESATGIKGSTRLEAKRQRRREGREAGRRRTIITEAEFLARRESVERVMVVRDRGEHTQIGVLEDGVLVEHYISGGGTAAGAAGGAGASMAGNVYLGRVQNVLPSMEAAFVDIGKGRNAVLYAGEVNWDAAGLEQHKARRIENALSSGQSVLVQVTKDPIGHKGARLTSQVSLPGRYLVYVPDGSMTGISRKLPDTERSRLKKILKQVVPDDAGVIVRTAAEGASEAELTADVERLRRAWEKIQKKAKSGNAPVLLHGEPDLTTRVVRDVFNEDFKKLIVSGERAWESISDYIDSVAPDLADRLHKWTGEKDVFAEHRVDEQLAKAMDRKVWLPSGGSLVIDRTEAMTVIDVNTGKFTGSGGNLEETVTKNNIEAAEEIVRQLRLRDIGGIIVVDFIDMVLESNRDLVVRRLLECLGRDRTKHQVAEVTSLGLVQMTRKRVGAGLIEVFSEPCEHCSGRGVVISSEPLDKSGAGDSGGDRGGRRGGKRSRAGAQGGRPDRSETPAPPTPSGPTPAQIAAAAYAAAVQSHEAQDRQDEPTTGPGDDQVVVDEHVGTGERGEELDGLPESSAATADAPTARPTATGRVSGRVTGRVTGRVGATPVTQPETDDEPAGPPVTDAVTERAGAQPTAASPARRRGARRAASTSVVSTASSDTAVFTATEDQTPQRRLTVSAAEAARDEGEAAAVSDPRVETSTPRRRRAVRRAAGAPAGPPPAQD